jgi:hypothetical protein|tara:strand:+ start:17910 stop:18179 length:270 start_codon:yes stop_codon:yes gene_type:complete
MAAIAIGDCTVVMLSALAGQNVYSIATPATADQADTIDVSTLFPNAFVFAACENATDGCLLSATAGTTSITLPSGGTDNEARTIYIMGY